MKINTLLVQSACLLSIIFTPEAALGHGSVTLNGGQGVMVKLLLELDNGEAEIGEISLPAGYVGSAEHQHQSTEIFYVIEGQLSQTVGGITSVLAPGMIGVVPKNETVIHGVVGDEAVRALIIWLPAGESARLIEKGFKPIAD